MNNADFDVIIGITIFLMATTIILLLII